MNILVIKSSVFGDNGNSSALVNAQVDALKAKHPQATVRCVAEVKKALTRLPSR